MELQARGFQVVGVDSDEEIIARAQERGAPVVRATWPAFETDAVDAIAFTRSLHHIHPLPAAVSRAREVLQPSGTLLVDDFAFDEADSATINWFMRVLDSRTARELIASTPDEFVTRLLASRDPVAAWYQDHDHELHTAAAMEQAVSRCFSIRHTQSVPYIYRYLVPVLPETPEAARFVEAIFKDEARLGKRGELTLIGRRIVGSLRVAGSM